MEETNLKDGFQITGKVDRVCSFLHSFIFLIPLIDSGSSSETTQSAGWYEEERELEIEHISIELHLWIIWIYEIKNGAKKNLRMKIVLGMKGKVQ